jgi:APA family basic amino acid/polyamine antiporter
MHSNPQFVAPKLAPPAAQPHLIRGVGLFGATTLNMIDMIGVGPFITIPLIVSAIGGPQAMLGWIFGALFAICDGLVWAELGAAMPHSGGSYGYLAQIYGPRKLGRLVSFLFVWQLSFSAPLSIASGCVGLSQYAAFVWPGLEQTWFARDLRLPLPVIGTLEAHIIATPATFVAIGVCVLAVILLYRRITGIARLSKVLWAGVLGTIAWIIIAGLTHFDAARAFSFPLGAFHLDHRFLTGLGAAMLVAAYDYWGYYNVCFLGGEIKHPEKNIPRALLLSIVLVSLMYIVMNISILGVVPWQEMVQAAKSDTHFYIVSTFMLRVYGRWAAYVAAALIMWTAFASVFSLLLGYSRVPFAAAQDGNYFGAFARVHPKYRFPYVSLLALGIGASLFCFLRLADIIAALVVIRILLQFLLQTVGVIVLRIRRPDLPRPFRMWFYPLPAILATAGFIFVLVSRQNFMKEIRYAAVILTVGVAIYVIRALRRREWPFSSASVTNISAKG